jgi:ABC-type bacteriocin/lantibiotic exporter with double-glycine peptidase domain
MEVEIRNLYYKFEDAEEPLLKDINLKINPGEKLCIAGYNGSGKTTLVQIISCYLSNFKGTVLYNRIPRNNFSQVSLRQSIGDYSSLEDIFKGTVRENITLGYAHIRFEDMVNVCEELGLMEFISKFPYGFDTPLMPEGKTIPRSIISKLILARSVVNKPHLLAIEEVLANMERTDRLKIAHLLTSKEKAWTLVAVSDDPLLAYHCDRIIVLKDGQIVAEGNYNEIKQSVHYGQVFKIND